MGSFLWSRFVSVGVVFCLLLSLFPMYGSEAPPLFTYTHMGVYYEFYDSYFIGYYQGDAILVESYLMGSKLSSQFDFSFSIDSNIFGLPLLTYWYRNGSRLIDVRHIISFGNNGFVKLSTEINGSNIMGVNKLFSYKVIFGNTATHESQKSKDVKLQFDYSDLSRNNIPHNKTTKASGIDLDFDGFNQTIVIDPAIGPIGISQGNAVPQLVQWSYGRIDFEDQLLHGFNQSSVVPAPVSNPYQPSVPFGNEAYLLQVFADAHGNGVTVTTTAIKMFDYNCNFVSFYWGGKFYDAYHLGSGQYGKSEIYLMVNGTWVQIVTAQSVPACTFNWVYKNASYSSATNVTAIKVIAEAYTGSSYSDSYIHGYTFLDDLILQSNASGVTTTSYGHYWSYSSTNTTYRWDFNYSFPSREAKELNCTYPKGHTVTSVYSVQNSTNLNPSLYSLLDYNATHKCVSILDSTINLYGKSYRLWTVSPNAIYSLRLLYNGTDIEYSSPNIAIQVNATLRDPFGQPIVGQQVDFSYNYSNVWFDQSLNDNDGLIHGASVQNVTIGSMANLTAVSCDGYDDYIGCGDVDDVEGIGALAVTLWVKGTSTPYYLYQGFVSKGEDETNYDQFIIMTTQGFAPKIRMWIRTTVAEVGTPWTSMNVLDDNWHFVIGQWDTGVDGKIRLYVDNVLGAESIALSGVIQDTSRELRIGDADAGCEYHSKANFHDVALFSRGLNDSERKWLFDYVMYGNVSQSTYDAIMNNGCVLHLGNYLNINATKFASAVTNSSGVALVNFTVPTTEALMYIHANTTGNYSGLETKTLKVSDIAVSLSSPSQAYVGDIVTFSGTAKYNLDSMYVSSGSIWLNGSIQATITSGAFSKDIQQTDNLILNYNLTSVSDGKACGTQANVASSITEWKWQYLDLSIVAQYPMIFYKQTGELYRFVSLMRYVSYNWSEPVVGALLELLNETSLLDSCYSNSSGHGVVGSLVPNKLSDTWTLNASETLYGYSDIVQVKYYINRIDITNLKILGDLDSFTTLWNISILQGIVTEHKYVLYALQNGEGNYTLPLWAGSGDAQVPYLWINDTSLWLEDPLEARLQINNFGDSSFTNVSVSVTLYSLYGSKQIDRWLFSTSEVLPSNFIVLNYTGAFGACNLLNLSRSFPIKATVSFVSDQLNFTDIIGVLPIVMLKTPSHVTDHTDICTSTDMEESLQWTGANVYTDSLIACMTQDLNYLNASAIQDIGIPEDNAITGTATLDRYIAETGQTLTVTVNVTNNMGSQASVEVKAKGEARTISVEPHNWALTSLPYIVDSAPEGIMTTKVVEVKIYLASSDQLMQTLSIDYTVFNSAPMITLNSPAQTNTLNGSTSFDFKVEDESNITYFGYRWDTEASFNNVSSPYDFEYDTNKLSNGRHILYAKAVDAVGFVKQESYWFTIDNAGQEWIWMDQLKSILAVAAKYSFIVFLALGFIVLLIGYAVGRAIQNRQQANSKQPIIVLDKSAIDELKPKKKNK